VDVTRHLRNWLPVLASLRGYRRADLHIDALAGLVVGIVTIPQAVAYAVMAGLPAQAGLYACVLPMLAYALLTPSREVVVGSAAVPAIMVAATLAAHRDAFGGDVVTLASVLCIEVGLLLFLMRALGLSGFVNLISQPVLGGFINAAVVLIVVSQLDDVLGVRTDGGGSVVEGLVRIVVAAPAANLHVLALAAISFTILYGVRGLVPRLLGRYGVASPGAHPLSRSGPLLAVIATTCMVVLLEWDVRFGVTTVGYVPDGLAVGPLPLAEPALWVRLVPSAAMIALVAYIETFSLAQSLAAARGASIDADQELVALGCANVAAGCVTAFPVAGSLSRSGVNVAAGVRTQASALASAIVIGGTLLLATPLLARLPHAVLAAVVIVSVLPLFEIGAIRELWRIYRGDAATHVATLLGALLFDVETGIAIGVVLSIAVFLRRSALPEVTEVGRLGDTAQFRSVERFAVDTAPRVLLLRVDESLYFGNADHVERRIFEQVLARPACRHVVLVFSPVNYVDTDGLDMLLRVDAWCTARGLALYLADVKTELARRFARAGVPARLHGRIFDSADEAERTLLGEGDAPASAAVPAA
jgi:SulP family sulfate permease